MEERMKYLKSDHYCCNDYYVEPQDEGGGGIRDFCYGSKEMFLHLWYMGQNGLEDHCNDEVIRRVNFCPYCGEKAAKTIEFNKVKEDPSCKK